MIGTKLGPYEITAKLGAGGMGEVYRATDTKLDRQVAIKVLPAEFTEDKERLARFEREAKLLAQLHHPNIASIFGLEESGGTKALVMELVEGPTLAERLEAGPFSFNESLSVSVQIAHALEEAHEKGIVHRDLKPQNIKASIEGETKVLDFGLAKAMDSAGTASGSAASASQLAASPTLTLGPTQMGMILGTAAYMAPEQAKGLPVDKRADIWAFGVVLFEMLTGRSLFAGDSVPDTLARVLQRDVDFGSLPESTSPAIRRLLRRCLERNPKNRLHDIADARIVIDDVISGTGDDAGSAAGAVPVAAAPPPGIRALPWAVAAAALAWGMWATLAGPAAESRAASVPVAFTVPLPSAEGRTIQPDSIALSRDGRRLAIYDARAPALLLRELAGFEVRPVPGTVGARNPFFSPDGAWLGFNADGVLKKVALAGGDPVKLCEASGHAPGATWGPGGYVYFTPTWTSGLWRVSDQGGEPERLTEPDPAKGETGHYWPSFLPGGDAAVITLFGAAGIRDSKVALLDLESRRITLLGGGAGAQYVASGHLVLFRHGVWLALPFDAKERRITGPESRVLPELRPLNPIGDSIRDLAFADDGLLAYVAAEGFDGGGVSRFAWIDRTGRVEPLPFAGHHYTFRGFDLAPDERRVAVARVADGEIQVWLYDLERGTKEQVTRDGQNFYPVWRPDGRQLSITSLLRGSFDLRLLRADGGAPSADLRVTEGDEQDLRWSADGRRSVFVSYSPETGKDISTFADGETGAVRTVVASPSEDDYPRLSRDGRWLSYASQGKLYVTEFPDGGERIQISANSSVSAWSQTTPELFYLEGGKLVALRYEISEGSFRPLGARELFEAPGQKGVEDTFAVTRDGQRFLFLIAEPGRRAEPELRVLTDGFAALRGAAEMKP